MERKRGEEEREEKREITWVHERRGKKHKGETERVSVRESVCVRESERV